MKVFEVIQQRREQTGISVAEFPAEQEFSTRAFVLPSRALVG